MTSQILVEMRRIDAPILAARFGCDISSRDFWDAGLDVVPEDIDRFEALAEGT